MAVFEQGKQLIRKKFVSKKLQPEKTENMNIMLKVSSQEGICRAMGLSLQKSREPFVTHIQPTTELQSRKSYVPCSKSQEDQMNSDGHQQGGHHSQEAFVKGSTHSSLFLSLWKENSKTSLSVCMNRYCPSSVYYQLMMLTIFSEGRQGHSENMAAGIP